MKAAHFPGNCNPSALGVGPYTNFAPATKYTPGEINKLRAQRISADAKAIEGGARLVFSGDQVERARKEMEVAKLPPEERTHRFWQQFSELDDFDKLLAGLGKMIVFDVEKNREK
jgi:hypothetical protein